MPLCQTKEKIKKNMMFGNLKKAFIHLSYLLFLCSSSFCEDKIQISPIINLEQLPATFERR